MYELNMKTILNFTNICSKQFLKDFAGAGQIRKKSEKDKKELRRKILFRHERRENNHFDQNIIEFYTKIACYAFVNVLK